jgi:hypothetical protein
MLKEFDMLKSLLLSLAKEIVFESLITVLRQEAQRSDTPIDDELVDYMVKAKPDLLAALNRVF